MTNTGTEDRFADLTIDPTFDPVQADAVRILCLDGNGHTYSRIVELEVYGN